MNYRGNSEFDPIGLTAAIRTAITEGLDKLADESVERIKESLDTPYPPASSPGDAPHKRTGELQASIQHGAVENLSVEIFSDSPYADYLEHGTSKMDARPFFTPETERLENEIEELLIQHLSAALGG